MEITGIKDQICDVCHKMWQLGWVAAMCLSDWTMEPTWQHQQG